MAKKKKDKKQLVNVEQQGQIHSLQDVKKGIVKPQIITQKANVSVKPMEAIGNQTYSLQDVKKGKIKPQIIAQPQSNVTAGIVTSLPDMQFKSNEKKNVSKQMTTQQMIDDLNKNTTNVTNNEGYTDTGKKYGDYRYWDYKNKSNYKIYSKNGKYFYYDEQKGKYTELDNENRITTPEQAKKEYEEAKKLGFKGNDSKLKIEKQLDLDTTNLTKKERKEYQEDLQRQQDEYNKKISEVRYGGAGLKGSLGEVRENLKGINENLIDPITDIPEDLKLGYLNTQLGLESFKKMNGQKNNYDKIKEQVDKYSKFNQDIATSNNLINQNTQNTPNQVLGTMSGLKNAGVGGTLGAIGGGIVGFATAGTGGIVPGMKTGAKVLGGAGYTKGQTEFTYQLESGYEYQALLEMGVPESIARKEAKQVGTENALIEAGESIVDLITLGQASKVRQLLGDKLVKKYGLETLKNWAKSTGGSYLTNIVSEGLEESAQEWRSIEGEKRAAQQSGIKRDNSQDQERILQSGIGGAFGGAVGGVFTRPVGSSVLGVFNNNNTTNNQIANQVDAFNLTPKERVQSPVVSPNSTGIVENSLTNDNRYQQLNDNNSQQKFYQEIKNTDSIQKQRVYQQANNKNILNNSKETHDLVDLIANLSEYTRRDYNLVTNNELQDRYQQLRERGKSGTINGFEENGTVTINLDSEKAFNKLLGHETTHLVENTKQYKQLQETLFELAKERGEYNRKLAEVQKTYEGTNANIMNELTSDLMGDYGFTKPEFVNKLHAKNYNLFTKIHDFIKHLYNITTAGSKERKLTEQALYLFDKANESQIKNKQNESVKGVSYSIKSDNNGNKFVNIDIEQKQFNNLTLEQQRRLAKKVLSDKFKDGIIINNKNIELPKRSIKEYTNPQEIISNTKKRVKYRLSAELENAIKIGKKINKNIVPNDNSHKYHNFAKDGWNYYYTRFKYGNIDLIGKINEGISNGKPTFYNITDIKTLSEYKKMTENGTLNKNETALIQSFLANNIPQNNKNVKLDTSSNNSDMQENTKYSLTEGNTSFSYDENAKRYDDLQDSTKIEFFKKDNGDIRINMLDKNNDVVNQFDVYSEVNSTRQLGDNIGKYIFDNAKDITNTIYLEENNKKSDTDYMMYHRPTETGITADNLTNQNVETPMPEDMYEHPEYYSPSEGKYLTETMDVLNKIRNKPNADIIIYRATTGDKINKGDWVTLSKSYAEHHNESQLDGKGKVIQLKVKAKDIQFAGDDLNEFGYFPKNDTKYSIANNSNQYNVLSDNEQKQNDSIVALSEAGKNTNVRLKDAPITGYTKDGAPIYRQANGVETFYQADEKTDWNSNVIVTPEEQLHEKIANSKDNIYTMVSKDSMKKINNSGLNIIYDDVNIDTNVSDKIVKRGADVVTDLVRKTEKILEDGTIKKLSNHEAQITYQENGYEYTMKINDNDNMTNIEDFNKRKISNLPKLSLSENNNYKELTPQTTSTDIINSINLPDDIKESKFYKNITEKSQFITEENRSNLSQEDIRFYETVSNKESMNKALERLDNGNMVDEITNWYAKDSTNADSSDVAEGWILLKRYQDAGDYNSMVQVAKKMREIGTKSGQTVQMYNLLSRLTPEGMVKYAQQELSDAYEVYIKDQSKEWIDANRDKFDLTPSETKFIVDTMNEVQNMEDGYDKKVKLAQIQAMMQNKLPPSRGAGIKAWMRISMLFNPKTQIRNVVGNALIAPVNMVGDTFAAGMDKLISKKTGVRTTGTPKISKLVKGAGKGLYESYNDFKLGIDTRNIQGNRFEIGQGKSFNENHTGKGAKARNYLSNKLNNIDKVLSFCLDAGDRPFYESAFVNSINNQLVLNNTTEVTQDMIDIATNEALQRTWQDNNKYTQFVLNIRRGLNNINIKGYGLGDIIIPFAKTPANLTKAIVDYSPVGLVKTLTVDASKFKKSLSNGQYTAQKQHQFVQNFGKATAGSLLYVLGYALAKTKLTGGKSDDDKDLANFMKNTLGITSYSIKIGDKSFTYDWAQPIAAPFSITSDLVNNKNEKANLLEQITSTLDVPFNLILEQSFMSGLQDVLSNYEGIPAGLLEQIMDLPARATPTLFKQITDMVDTTQRTTFEKGEPVQSAINSIKAKIPTLSKDLAPTRDTLGREIKKYGGDVNPFNVFLNPANMNKGKESKSAKEIYRVYQKTGDKKIMPKVAPYDVQMTIDGKTYSKTLNAKERSQFQKISGDIVEKNVKKLNSNYLYKNELQEDEKAEVINGIVDYAYNVAKSKALKKPISRNYKKIDSQVKSGYALYDVYADRVYNRR